MSEQRTATPRPKNPGKASERTVKAAREIIRAANEDFDSPPYGSVMAAWSDSGVLLVVARGTKAHRLDRLLRQEGIAIPDGRIPRPTTDIA